MIEYWDFYLEGYDASCPSGMGTASTLHHDEPRDKVAELREVVAEVTGKPVEQPPRPRMGFL